MTVRGQFPGQGRFTRDDNGRHRFRPMQTTVTTVEATVESQNANVLQIEYFWQDDFFLYAKILSTGAAVGTSVTHDLSPAEGKILSTGATVAAAATHDLSPAEGKILSASAYVTAAAAHDASLTSPADVGTVGTAEVTPASNFNAAAIAAAAAVPVATATVDRTPVEGKILSTGASPSATATHGVTGTAAGDLGASATATVSPVTDFAATSIGATAAAAQATATTTRDTTASVATGANWFTTIVRAVTGFVAGLFGANVTATADPAAPIVNVDDPRYTIHARAVATQVSPAVPTLRDTTAVAPAADAAPAITARPPVVIGG